MMQHPYFEMLKITISFVEGSLRAFVQAIMNCSLCFVLLKGVKGGAEGALCQAVVSLEGVSWG